MKLSLVSKQQIQEGVFTLTFHPEQPIVWQAGQYMHYQLPHEQADDRGTERWFTISAAPYEQNIQITTRFFDDKSSSFKRTIMSLNVGDTIEADGPEGDFVLGDPAEHYVFIIGGIGITPLHAMLRQLAHDGNTAYNIDLLYINRDDNFVFGDELKQLAEQLPGLHIHWLAQTGPLDADAIKSANDDANAHYYISGPEPMVQYYKGILSSQLGVSEDHIKLDEFPGYPAPEIQR